MKNLNGRVAALTGAASGIGRALAVELANKGCHLALADLNEAGLEETAALIKSAGVSFSLHKVDVSKEEAVKGFAEAAVREHGEIHLIINNAGVDLWAPASTTSTQDFEWLMQIDFWGVVYGTQAFLPYLKKVDEAHIVNISSIFGLIGLPAKSAYSAAKFAVKGYTESLRQELEIEGRNITVSCVHPGAISSNIDQHSRISEEGMQGLGLGGQALMQQLGKLRLTTPETAARTIIKGIEGNEARVLVGLDAVAIDAMQRFIPAGYQDLLATTMKLAGLGSARKQLGWQVEQLLQQADKLAGKTCLVTGATSGIGLITATALARMGAKLVIVGRSEERARAAVQQIHKDSKNQDVDYLLADLSSQDDVRALAAEFQSKYDRLDVLINNAGAMFTEYQESKDGIELTFALNHLSYFLLTNLLLDLMKKSGRARIINVASNAHAWTVGEGIDFDDIGSKRTYPFTFGYHAYGNSKLANLMFTFELARRLQGAKVTVNCLHPGFVDSGFASNSGAIMNAFLNLRKYLALTPEEGAQNSIFLAASDEVEGVNGQYFVENHPASSTAASRNVANQKRLWQVSEEMTGLA